MHTTTVTIIPERKRETMHTTTVTIYRPPTLYSPWFSLSAFSHPFSYSHFSIYLLSPPPLSHSHKSRAMDWRQMSTLQASTLTVNTASLASPPTVTWRGPVGAESASTALTTSPSSPITSTVWLATLKLGLHDVALCGNSTVT